MARALHNSAEVLLNQGDFASTERVYRKALSILQEVGDKRSSASELVNLGLIAVKRGDFATGHSLYAESLRNYQEAGDKQGIAIVTGNTGNLLRSEGKMAEALAHYELTLELSNELGYRASTAIALQAIGDVRYEQGNLAEAVKMFRQALTIQEEIGAKSNYADSLAEIGKVRRQQGDSDAALRSYQQALAIQQQLGERGSAAETELAIAELDCDSGRAVEAQQLIGTALKQFQLQREPVQQISALTLLTKAFLQESKVANAKDTIAQARSLAKKTPDVVRQLSLSLANAYLLSATKNYRAAEQAAKGVRTRAHRLGLLRLYLEASLAVGEIQLKQGGSSAGRKFLEALTETARSSGFELVAHKASSSFDARNEVPSLPHGTLGGR